MDTLNGIMVNRTPLSSMWKPNPRYESNHLLRPRRQGLIWETTQQTLNLLLTQWRIAPEMPWPMPSTRSLMIRHLVRVPVSWIHESTTGADVWTLPKHTKGAITLPFLHPPLFHHHSPPYL
jgi:hypothetical protein